MTRAIDTTGNRLAIRQAIARAANRTGVDFGYLLNQAKSESGLDPTVKAGNSSATGLYQFIDQSWLGVIKQHGAEHGYGWAADAVERHGGRWMVRDGATRAAVFALRKDPEASALMAGAYASDNKDELTRTLGRDVGSTDLYFAHFLGLAGAKKFLKAADARPGAMAAALFPREAAANHGIFYSRSGQARSLADVYALMGRKIDGPAALPEGLGDASGEVLLADGAPLSATPPTARTGAAASFDLAALTGDDKAASPLDRLQGHGVNMLRPQPQQARLAYMMVLGSLDLA